jgi:tripartite-type tricarboxylate transporter receptor subunit TctC
VTNWHGLIGPKGMPQSIVTRINGEVAKIIKQKDMEKQLQGDGLSADGGPPEEFQQRITREIAQWKKVVAESGIKIN